MKTRLCGILFLFINTAAFAKAETTLTNTFSSGNMYWDLLIIAFVATLLILLLVSITLLKTFQKLSKEFINPTPLVKQEIKMLEYREWAKLQNNKPGIWSKLLGLKPIEYEKDILLEHEFDGIAELDNPTPAWFMWLFYASIAIAVGYMFTYHVFNWGKLQEEEYVIEMEEAELAKKAYLAGNAEVIDENTVKESTDAHALSAGAAIYTANCAACHGDKGQGLVGPNLTDEYWLHGGKINDVFKIIKYGVQEKGMIAWGKTLTPKQISDVASFIKSIKGTKPENAKAPQGKKEE